MHSLLHIAGNQGHRQKLAGLKALQCVNLTVREGPVHTLLGENDAGKSTLMLFGAYAKDEGEIFFEGQPVEIRSPQDAEVLGMRDRIMVMKYAVGSEDAKALAHP